MSNLLRDVRELVQSVRPRNDRDAMKAFEDLREWFAPLGCPPCPACGHLIDYRDGTHIRTGYRQCITPPRAGSWNAERTATESETS